MHAYLVGLGAARLEPLPLAPRGYSMLGTTLLLLALLLGTTTLPSRPPGMYDLGDTVTQPFLSPFSDDLSSTPPGRVGGGVHPIPHFQPLWDPQFQIVPADKLRPRTGRAATGRRLSGTDVCGWP